MHINHTPLVDVRPVRKSRENAGQQPRLFLGEAMGETDVMSIAAQRARSFKNLRRCKRFSSSVIIYKKKKKKVTHYPE